MFRDIKVRAIVLQVALFATVFAALTLLVITTFTNLKARGIPIGFDFLTMSSRLVISESIFAYESNDPYYWAILVGVANTIAISVVVIFFSSILGLVIGLARLSNNPLAAGTSKVWVEVARNFPPIVLLIFLYSLWWKVLPPVGEAIGLASGVYLSMRGLNVPSISISMEVLGLVLMGLSPLFLVLKKVKGLPRPVNGWLVPVGLVVFGLGLWLVQPQLSVTSPAFMGSNFEGGLEVTPELTTILFGLTIYTTGFIAEIVRSGVLSVKKGQWEAGYSLGLSRGKILRLIVMPQTLRVVVPPLNSQFINVVKNSTLAIAVGYPDFLSIMNTIISKSSHAIEGVFIILGVYLLINLSLSSAANWFNRRIAIVER